MTYEVWLTARHPMTLSIKGTILVHEDEDRLQAEAVLERAHMTFAFEVYGLRNLCHGAIVSAAMKYPQAGVETQIERLEEAQEALAKIRAKKQQRYDDFGTPRASGA